ncbi:hypothetical protein ABT061_04190 [Streptosporangium sp. NPDC002544]|uniref:hypothetical protein n=1 Tax=Streptosporangium sp. NPDC002544 TaxID=3154538 RepID=UPI0033240D41
MTGKRKRTARRRTSAPVLLVGWLFADLLLGLTVIMLGAQAPPPVPVTPVAGAGTESPTPSASPCANRVGGVQAKPVKVSFQVSPGAGDKVLTGQVKKKLLRYRKHLAGRQAGMVLTFGAGGAGEGVRLATRVNTALGTAYPKIFGTAATRNFHDLAAASGSISMEIYFVTNGCSSTPKN